MSFLTAGTVEIAEDSKDTTLAPVVEEVKLEASEDAAAVEAAAAVEEAVEPRQEEAAPTVQTEAVVVKEDVAREAEDWGRVSFVHFLVIYVRVQFTVAILRLRCGFLFPS